MEETDLRTTRKSKSRHVVFYHIGYFILSFATTLEDCNNLEALLIAFHPTLVLPWNPHPNPPHRVFPRAHAQNLLQANIPISHHHPA
jgi:hypothetical protein